MSDPEIDDLGIRTYRIGPSGTGGRGPIVVGAFVVLLVAVVGFAALGGRDGTPAPSDAAVVPGDPTARPTGTRRPTPTPTEAPHLPNLPNEPMEGAPIVALGTADGSDLQMHFWRAGEEDLEWAHVLAGLLAPPSVNAYTHVDLAPRPDWASTGVTGVAVESVFTSDESLPNVTTRVFGPAGIRWERADRAANPSVLWAPDGSRLTVGGLPVWSVLDIDAAGGVSERTVRVADDPLPTTSPSPYGPYEIPPHPFPWIYSADNGAVYGVMPAESAPFLRPVVRVRLEEESLVAENVHDFPRSNRLAPTGGYSELLDPISGRWAELEYGESDGRLVLFAFDGSREEILAGVNVTSHTWTDDGRLVVTVLQTDPRTGGPGPAEVLLVDPDDSGSTQLLSARRIDGAWIAATRRGYVLLTMWASDRMQLALLRPADGAIASVEVPGNLAQRLQVLELIEP
jgi:hypothetical protein